MSRSRKIFLGILSVLPFILFALYIAFFLKYFLPMFRHQQNLDPEGMFAQLFPIIAVGVLMALTSFALLIYYIIHAVNNKRLDSSERIIWILVFLFAGMVGFPIYWYMRIWKEEILTL